MSSSPLCDPFGVIESRTMSGGESNARYTVDRAEIDSILRQWQDPTAHPNTDVDSYWEVLKQLPTNASPVAIVAYRQGKVDAALVGRLETGIINVAVGYKSIARLKRRQLVLIYRGLLGDGSTENCRAMVRVVSDLLQRQLATVAYFNAVDSRSPLYSAVLEIPLLCRDWTVQRYIHRSMDLPPNSSAVRRLLSPKVRKNLNWQERRLLTAFENKVTIRCFSRFDELAQLYRDVEQIAATTYQRSLGVGFCDDPVLRARLAVETGKDWMRAYVLYLNDRPAAFWIGKLCHGIFYSDFMGYDSEYAKYSPGMFLIIRVIELLCEPNGHAGTRVSTVDFGFGDAQYKVVLGNKEWYEASLRIYSPNLKGALTNVMCSSAGLVNSEMKRLLSRYELLQRVKTQWRQRMLSRHTPQGSLK